MVPRRDRCTNGSANETGINGDEKPRWSPDGKQLVFDVSFSGGSRTLFVVNADGTGTHTLGVRGSNPDWSPDGRQIAFSDQIDRVAVIDVRGRGFPELTKIGCGDDTPAWSPDGKQIAFSRGKAFGAIGDLSLVRADGSDLRRLTTGGGNFDPSRQRVRKG
jgi:Tol biopolymer transport system component